MRAGPVVITGGAGFVGSNLANRLLSQGETVRIFDNLSRKGVERNVEWLQNLYGTRVELWRGDVRSEKDVRRAVADAVDVYHFAAQVAVTTSLTNPLLDFEVNARGTLNVLEAIRGLANPPPIYFTSTNKVYGDLGHVPLVEAAKRYLPAPGHLLEEGISEAQPLDLYSPYGCSKGTADQYVLDYARTFGLRAVVFRMSCIYGPHQYGNEDQGWLAHFLRRSLSAEPITICGTGKQVRDALFVEDLIEAFVLARRSIDALSGNAFNMGGGPANTLSLLELLDLIEELAGERPSVAFTSERVGDQRYYVTDARKFSAMTGWKAQIGVREGLRELYLWLTLRGDRPRSSYAVTEIRL